LLNYWFHIVSEIIIIYFPQYGILAMVGLFGGAAKFPLPGIVTEAKKIAGIFVGSLEHLQQLVKLFTNHKAFLSFI